jgi:mono/diheme cytochrome c family protein
MRPVAATLLAACALLLLARAAIADESEIQLVDAPGKDLVVANCAICHSLDYVPMNSHFLDRKGWEASVNKMIKVMGAPISPENAAGIVDYLATQYGKKP